MVEWLVNRRFEFSIGFFFCRLYVLKYFCRLYVLKYNDDN